MEREITRQEMLDLLMRVKDKQGAKECKRIIQEVGDARTFDVIKPWRYPTLKAACEASLIGFVPRSQLGAPYVV